MIRPGGIAVAGDEDLVADAAVALAVGAGACHLAGRFGVEALLVLGRGNRSCPLHGGVQRIHHLVHSRNDDHGFRPIDDSRYPVAVAIDVHHLAVQTQRVRAGDEHVRAKALLHDCFPLLRGRSPLPVEGAVVPCPDSIQQADLLSGHRAAPAHAGTGGNPFQRLFQRFGFVCAVAGFKMAAVEILDQHIGAFFIVFPFRVGHKNHSFFFLSYLISRKK